ncbi:hypothetical protein KQX54_007935 [Cotesia glomerata]|uniref:Uncharacterized protein n=1 Tax=Cotesia glomerata TaxID=32391 RepID=A0AAV7IJP8_COTGL|nr:hypothetical protein KQX54_007935 [Cotesia glomerata]
MNLLKSLLFISALAMVLLCVNCENKEPRKVLRGNLLMRKEREAGLLKRLTRSPSPGFVAPRVDDNGGPGCG